MVLARKAHVICDLTARKDWVSETAVCSSFFLAALAHSPKGFCMQSWEGGVRWTRHRPLEFQLLLGLTLLHSTI